MAVRYTPTQVNHGFDKSPRPDWQMVPVGATRVLTVTGSRGLVPRVRNADPRVAALTAVTLGAGASVRLILTGGLVAGRAWVEWVPSASFVGAVTNDFTLEVSVKAEKTLRTAFHYVDDGRRQVTRRWIDDFDRRVAALDTLIDGANAILSPQANVRIVRKSADKLTVAQNLGRVVRFSSDPAKDEWDDLLALGDATADFNVFFVREYEDDSTPNRDDVDAGTIASDKMCIFEDRMTQTSATLAHETIHALGISGHLGSTRYVMASGEHGLGRFLPKAQINTINPSGT